MTALGNVINWQKLDYDFSFHKQEFQTNIAVLVLSEGKSILKVPAVAAPTWTFLQPGLIQVCLKEHFET